MGIKETNLTLDARAFLSRFNHKKITYQTLKNSKPAHTFEGTLESLSTDTRLSRESDVYFMVNEGDGLIHAPHTTCRSQASVITLKSLYIDTDNCPFATVKSYLLSVGIKPHLIVETSKNRYHVYILIDDTPVTAKSLAQWKACQLALVYLGDKEQKETGCDVSMRDHSRILRIPGFYNHKKKHLVTLKRNSFHPAYTLAELYDKLEAKNFNIHSVYTEKQSYTISNSRISEGYRHPEMTSFISHLLNKDVSPDIVKLAFYRYAEEHFESCQDFLPYGKRHPEVEDFITYKLTQLKQEKEESRVTKLTEILASKSIDPFELPDDFYFEAPGLVGDIVKEICSKARYPIPSFALGTALATLGSIKSQQSSSLGHAPSNYFLCLSGTGSGKNYAQEVMSHTFAKLGLGSLLSFGIRSEKGIARFLENNASVGVLSLDEAEGFFSTLSDKYSPHYLRACKSLLLELYTSTNMPHKSLGQVGDAKQKPIILRYPRLSILAYGVLHTLHESFNKKSISDGLLQRFIVLTNYKSRVRNQNFVPAASLNSNCFEELADLTKKQRFASEEDFLRYQDLEAEVLAAKSATKKSKLEQELEALKATKPASRKTLGFSAKALTRYNAYSDSLDAQINKEMTSQSGLEGLYSRAAEQVGRLCIASAHQEISDVLVDYYITFVDSRIKALRSYVDDSFNSALASKCESLIMAVATLSQKLERATVSKREILRLTKFQSARELDEILRFLVDSGELQEFRKKLGSRGPNALCYRLGDIQ